ncbi:hypothetical protein ACHAXT_000919 [Thalassiosira profunda]
MSAKGTNESAESADQAYAARLQHADDRAAMMNSDTGKAFRLVESVISIARTINEAYPTFAEHKIEAVSHDDMVWFAEHMMGLQKEYGESQQREHTKVDVGFHYTQSDNIPKIRTHGLLTKGERKEKSVTSAKTNASFFGDGIYTANNPTSFRHFGDVGLIVGRLKGKVFRTTKSLSSGTDIGGATTVIGDKLTTSPKLDSNGFPLDARTNEVVLRTSKQVLPMIRYSDTLLKSPEGKQCIQDMKENLLLLMYEFFNNEGKPPAASLPDQKTPSAAASASARAAFGDVGASASSGMSGKAPTSPFATPGGLPAPTKASVAHAPPFGAQSSSVGTSSPAKSPETSHLATSIALHLWFFVAVTSPMSPARAFAVHALLQITLQLLNATSPPELSAEAQSPLESASKSATLVAVADYKRMLTKFYIEVNLKKVAQVDAILNKYKGKEPEMFVKLAMKYNTPNALNELFLARVKDIDRKDCLALTKLYIQVFNPAKAAGAEKYLSQHKGKEAEMFAKLSEKWRTGRGILKRLAYAFTHGLTFTVGTSATTGQTDQCTWASIHHKTSTHGGAAKHGFPDAHYFVNCNGELDGLRVPPAHSLDYSGNEFTGP